MLNTIEVVASNTPHEQVVAMQHGLAQDLDWWPSIVLPSTVCEIAVKTMQTHQINITLEHRQHAIRYMLLLLAGRLHGNDTIATRRTL